MNVPSLLVAAGLLAVLTSQCSTPPANRSAANDTLESSMAIEAMGVVADVGCKPTAPLEIEVQRAVVSNGIAEIDYTVQALSEAQEVRMEVEGSSGVEILRHNRADALGIQQGLKQRGYARMRLPADYLSSGAQVEIGGAITFLGIGDDGTEALETAVATRLIRFGPPPAIEGVTEVISAGEVTLDMNAQRTEQR